MKLEKKLFVLLFVPLLSAFLITFLVMYPSFTKEKNFIHQSDFIEGLNPSSWKALYVDPLPQVELWNHCETDSRCPANPKALELFTLGGTHDEKHVEKVKKLRGKRFWVGQIFPKGKILEWKKRGATSIILGYFYGHTEVFVNGYRIMLTDWSTTRLPTVINIQNRPNEDLFVAVRILHDMDEPFPDSLFVSGVVSDLGLEKHLRHSEYNQLVKPAMGIGFSFGLAFIFTMLWITSWRRQEFAAFAMMSLLQVPSQALLIPFVWLHLGNYTYHRLGFILAAYQAIAILFLGLSISRIRTWYTSLGLMVLLILPWCFLMSSWDTDQFYLKSIFVYDYFELSAYLISVGLIISQAILVAKKRGELWDPHREHKLYIFALMLFSVALIQYFGKIESWDMRMIYTEFVISILAISLAHEYKRQANFVSRSPVSKYHQLAKEITQLSCLVFSLDLKNSELLFNYGAEQGMGGSLVNKLMYHLSKIIYDNGAELISSEGDSILFFIPAEQITDDILKKAINLCIKLELELKNYLKLTELPDIFELRMALEEGAIRPIWHDLGSKKLPGWEQVGNSTVFVDLARMLEAEASQIPRNETALVVKPDLCAKISASFTQLKFRKSKTTIKHGRILELEMATISHR